MPEGSCRRTFTKIRLHIWLRSPRQDRFSTSGAPPDSRMARFCTAWHIWTAYGRSLYRITRFHGL